MTFGNLEEVFLALLNISDVGDRQTSMIGNREGRCGVESASDEELYGLWQILLDPVERLAILRLQIGAQILLVHLNVRLAEGNRPFAQVANDILWGHFDHAGEQCLCLGC